MAPVLKKWLTKASTSASAAADVQRMLTMSPTMGSRFGLKVRNSPSVERFLYPTEDTEAMDVLDVDL